MRADQFGRLLIILACAMVSCTPDPEAAVDPCVNAADVHACRWDDQDLGPDHPCRLLTMQEIADVVQRPLDALPGSRRSDGLCFGSYLQDLNYSYTVGPSATAKFNRQRAGGSPIADAGREAVWDLADRILHVRTGRGYFYIEVPRLSYPKRVALELAGIALARIEEEEGA